MWTLREARELTRLGDVRLERLRATSGTWGYEEMRAGVLVQSQFRSRWFGIVREVGVNREGTPWVMAELLCTADGRRYRKPRLKRLHPGWLRHVEAVPFREGAPTA